MIYHYLTMFMAGINVLIFGMLLYRYSRYIGRGIPALNYCIALMTVGTLFSILVAASFLIPEGLVLDIIMSVLLCTSLWINTFFISIVFTITTRESVAQKRFQRAILVATALLSLVYLTDPIHQMAIGHMVKYADGFLYDMQFGPLAIPVTIYSYLLSFIAIVRVFRSGSVGTIQTRGIRWLLVFSTLLPSLFSGLEALVPLFSQLRISQVSTWLSASLICYLFFGYLFTSRQMAINVMDDVYVVFDLHGYCVDVNEKGRQFFIQHIDTPTPRAEQFEALLAGQSLAELTEYELRMGGENGVAPSYHRISAFNLSYGMNQYCGEGYIIREVTEYRLKMDQLNDMATQDALTGAKNRRFLHDNAESIIQRATESNVPLTILMMDLDFFKRVNDVYGHLAGDEVLTGAYRIFEENVRTDDVVFRYGGEEFLVLCESTGLEDGKRMAERIRSAVENHTFVTSEGDINITVSIGVCSCIPVPGDSIEQLVEAADQFLYRAKQNGRNRVEWEKKVLPGA